MNNQMPELESRWKLSHPDAVGRDMIHKVVRIEDGEIITLCMAPDGHGIGGFSWLGSVEDFYKNFKFVCGPKKD